MSVASFIASQRAEYGIPHAKCCRFLGCRPPATWDHLEVSFASSMGPPLRQSWDHLRSIHQRRRC
jgi:hypothetical protein